MNQRGYSGWRYTHSHGKRGIGGYIGFPSLYAPMLIRVWARVRAWVRARVRLRVRARVRVSFISD